VEEMDHLDPSTFKRMFRVDRSTFDKLLDLIAPHLIQRNEVKAKNSSGSFICMRTLVGGGIPFGLVLCLGSSPFHIFQ
jgi:hypothetical protein